MHCLGIVLYIYFAKANITSIESLIALNSCTLGCDYINQNGSICKEIVIVCSFFRSNGMYSIGLQ